LTSHKLLSDLLTEEGKLRMSELERWPFSSEDVGPGVLSRQHLSEELGRAIGYHFEAEEHGGPVGSNVEDSTASGGMARKALSTDPGGVLVEVS